MQEWFRVSTLIPWWMSEGRTGMPQPSLFAVKSQNTLDFRGTNPQWTRLMDMRRFWMDLCYGARGLRNQPGFAAIAILTLALGIGASTTIFSVIYNVLLDPFPY